LDDLDIDFEKSIVIIEWARDFLDDLYESWLLVEIDRSSQDDRRTVKISGHGPRWQEVDFALGN